VASRLSTLTPFRGLTSVVLPPSPQVSCTIQNRPKWKVCFIQNVEEYDHSTTNLFDNLAIGIGDRIPSRAMALESFFNGQFLFVGGFLRRSRGFCPVPGGFTNVKKFGGEKFNGEDGTLGHNILPPNEFGGIELPLDAGKQAELNFRDPGSSGEIFFSNFFSRGLLPQKFWRVYWPSEFHQSNFIESGRRGAIYRNCGNAIPR